MGKLYTVAEHFYSFQGEGYHLGRAAYFVRLYGCDVQCSWCDSDFTWRKELRPKHLGRMSVSEIANICEKTPQDAFVVLTGGEPCLYDLQPLVDTLHSIGKKVHLETAGHKAIYEKIDWITISPKYMFGCIPLEDNLAKADELKFIISNKEDFSYVEEYSNRSAAREIWLHPEYSSSCKVALMSLIASFVKEHSGKYRAGYQLHKVYNVE